MNNCIKSLNIAARAVEMIEWTLFMNL